MFSDGTGLSEKESGPPPLILIAVLITCLLQPIIIHFVIIRGCCKFFDEMDEEIRNTPTNELNQRYNATTLYNQKVDQMVWRGIQSQWTTTGQPWTVS